MEVTGKLFADDEVSLVRFGWEVATDKNRILSGAYSQYEAGKNDVGVAYVFECSPDSGWKQVAKLFPKVVIPDENFGVSVSIRGDIAVVEANSEGSSENRPGAVYEFERNTAGQWLQILRLTYSEKVFGDKFGSAVEIINDTVFVGATSINSTSDENADSRSGGVLVYQLDDFVR